MKNFLEENIVHPTAIIDDFAVLGKNNHIGPFVYIGPGVSIGNNNRIEGYISIGMPGEHKDHFTKFGDVIIGNNNTIREFVTINSGTFRQTSIGNRNIMLRGSHLSHDSILEDDVTVSCSVLIGGESIIMRGANLGLGAVIHQRQVIGSYAMLGMSSTVTKTTDIHPGGVYVGSPAKYLKSNVIGLKRSNVSEEFLDRESARFSRLRHPK